MELLRAIRSYISSCLSFEPGPSCRVSKSSDTVVLVKNAGASSATSTYNPSYIFRIINDDLFDVFEHYDGEFLKVRSLSASLTDAGNKYVFYSRVFSIQLASSMWFHYPNVKSNNKVAE